jgi:hypothetical protein
MKKTIVMMRLAVGVVIYAGAVSAQTAGGAASGSAGAGATGTAGAAGTSAGTSAGVHPAAAGGGFECKPPGLRDTVGRSWGGWRAR